MSSSTGATPSDYSNRWEDIWAGGLKRGEQWDATRASPALVDLLTAGKVEVKNKTVFVPGCGRGYDLPIFVSFGAREVVGLELSPTAAGEAQAYLDEVAAQRQQGPGQAAAASPSPSGTMRVAQGDFFTWSDEAAQVPGWDVGYDYTFGCAMHPSMRQDWARHWGRHVRPGGLLVTLVFPVNPAADPAVGPPFPVSPELYEQLLRPQGFEVVLREPVPSELSHPPRAGKEVMMLWRKKEEEEEAQ